MERLNLFHDELTNQLYQPPNHQYGKPNNKTNQLRQFAEKSNHLFYSDTSEHIFNLYAGDPEWNTVGEENNDNIDADNYVGRPDSTQSIIAKTESNNVRKKPEKNKTARGETQLSNTFAFFNEFHRGRHQTTTKGKYT